MCFWGYNFNCCFIRILIIIFKIFYFKNIFNICSLYNQNKNLQNSLPKRCAYSVARANSIAPTVAFCFPFIQILSFSFRSAPSFMNFPGNVNVRYIHRPYFQSIWTGTTLLTRRVPNKCQSVQNVHKGEGVVPQHIIDVDVVRVLVVRPTPVAVQWVQLVQRKGVLHVVVIPDTSSPMMVQFDDRGHTWTMAQSRLSWADQLFKGKKHEKKP